MVSCGRPTDSARDGLDFNLGKRLAVAVFLAVTLAALFVKHDDFIAFHVAQYAGAYAGAFDVGGADGHLTVVLDEMHGIEGDFIAFSSCQPVDEDLLTFLNFELLTGDGNNCEHIENQKFGEKELPFFKKAGKGTIRSGKKQVMFVIKVIRSLKSLRHSAWTWLENVY